jgi:hypothetical protein
MFFRFAIVFMFAVLGPCESLMMLEKWECDLTRTFLSISPWSFLSVVLTQMASLGEETGTGYRVRAVGKLKQLARFTQKVRYFHHCKEGQP